MPELPCLVSYPKCGRTWLRMMALHALDDVSVKGEYFSWSHHVSDYANRDIVILVRDPRDILVSYYFYYNFSKPRKRLYDNLSDFIRSPRGLVRLTSHWKKLSQCKYAAQRFEVLCYEDMIKDPGRELTRFLDFIGQHQSVDKVEQAVDAASFEKLAAWERTTIIPATDMGFRKFRKGKIGDYKNHFTEEDMAYVDVELAKLTDEELWWRYGRR